MIIAVVTRCVALWALMTLAFAPALATISHDLLDLSCARDDDCHVFVVPQMGILSRCLNKECMCSNGTSTLAMPCQPVDVITANLVGGECPCSLPYTMCLNDYCMCTTNFSPSPDKRRCLPTLGFNCSGDVDCHGRIAHSICANSQCMCDPDFVARPDNTECLVNVNNDELCVSDVQCKHILGSGGVCNISETTQTGSCACNATDYVMAIIQTGNRTRHLCENRKAVGDICSNNVDCYQLRPVDGEAPPLECFLRECICSAEAGYEQSGRYCAKRSGAATFTSQIGVLGLAVVALWQ